MTLKAIGDVVLLEPINEEQKTENGIILDDTILRLQKAKILSLDESDEIIKSFGLKTGDTVLAYKTAIMEETISKDRVSTTIHYCSCRNIKFIETND